jgi:CSLREA domain-containing protein
MNRRFLTIVVLAMLMLPAGLVGVGADRPAPGTIVVTTTEDELNADGDCSLREAIFAANINDYVDACGFGSGDDIIVLPAGIYVLTIPGAGEDNNQTGDLDILDNLTLVGEGAKWTIIRGKGFDRILHIPQGATVEISGVTVAKGQAFTEAGGGILNQDGALTLTDSVLRNNIARYGGGLANCARYRDVTVKLEGCRVVGNRAIGGGGLYNRAGRHLHASMALNASTVLGNTAQYGGGLLQSGEVATNPENPVAFLSLDSSTVSDNIANGEGLVRGSGGGILIQDSEAELTNSTISGNQVAGIRDLDGSRTGGGIAVVGERGSARVSLLNMTVADNSSNGAGGGIAALSLGADAGVTFKNTLIGENEAQFRGTSNCYALALGTGAVRLASLGHNLEDRNQCRLDEPTDWTQIDPRIGPLANNGGGTATHELLEGSPARDVGDDGCCPCVDQRGVDRPQCGCSDIGSYEALPDTNPPVVTETNPPHGASDVALDTWLVITFSEPVKPDSLAFEIFPDPGGWSMHWQDSDMMVIGKHNGFASGTRHTVHVESVSDLAGNLLAEPVTWYFTTEYPPDEDPGTNKITAP